MSVTEPHLSQKTFHEIDELLELQQFALEHVHEAIFFVNVDARITYVNQSASTYLGYSKDELLSMSVLDLDPLFTHDIWVGHWRDLMEHKSLLIETQQRSKCGKIVPVEVRANYLEYNGIGYNMAFVQEITERKNIQQMLDEKNERYSQIFDNSTDNLYILEVTEDGRFVHTDINPAYEQSSGIPRDIIVGRYTDEIEDEAIRDTLLKKFNTCLDAGEKTEYISEFDLPTGHKIFHSTLSPIRNEHGRIVRIVGVARDITKLKQIENDLQRQEQHQRMLLDNFPYFIWLKDKDSRLLAANNQYARVAKVNSTNDLIGKTDFDFFPHDLAEKYVSDDRSVMENGAINNVEELYVDENNERHWMETWKSPLIVNGEIVGTVGCSRDITKQKENEELLHKKEQEFRSLAENAHDPIYRYDRNLRRIYVNSAVERLSGKNAAMLLGKTSAEAPILSSDDVIKVMKSLEKVLNTGEPDEIEVKFVTDEEYELYFQHSHVPEFDADGTIAGVLAIGRDITAHKQLQKDLNAREEMFRTLAENSPNIIMRYDQNCKRIYANPAYSKATGIPINLAFNAKPDTQWGVYLNMLTMTPQEYQERIKSVIRSGKNDHFSVEWYRLNDGEHVIHDLHIVAERDDNGNITGALAIGHDISEQKEREKKIEFMAHHDALTGLPNRILAKNRMEQSINHAKRHHGKSALIFIDLDGFKTINDSLGHSVGDVMLQSVSSRLQECILESDTLSRQGGDEFLLILQDTNDKEDVIAITDKLIEAFEHPFSIDSHLLSVSASIGIALYPDHGENFETLLQNADAAMYKAKESGKNTYRFFTRQMNNNIVGQFKIQNDLKTALQNNEFVLFYQPQIDLAENRIVGAEALIRWLHPQLGMVAPMSFIPVAESSGLIVQIGQWVIEEACRQAALWHKNAIEISVAVNISAVQFKRGNLEAVVRNALASSGLDPRFLELELTESIMMHNVESTLQTVQALKALGIQLSIDDFGTGYSSLAYLKRFSVDKLKIDQSFVRDILRDKEDAVIVKTIVQMAKSLNLKTIAEGVEDAHVLAIIDAYGCDEVQGYHFAKPMESSDFEHYHANFNNEIIL